MWEKFKTVVLCFLIVSSLILTYRLWYGSPEYEAMMPPIYERISFGEAPPLEEFLQPDKIVYLEPLVKEPELVDHSPAEEEEDYGENSIAPDGDINSQEEESLLEELSPQVVGFETYLLNPESDSFHSLWGELSREIKELDSQNFRFRRKEGENQLDFHEILNPTLVFYFNLPLSPQVFFPDEESIFSIPPIKEFHLFLEEERARGIIQTPQGDLYQVEWDLNPNHLLSLGEEVKSGKDPDGSFLEEIIEQDQELKENLAAENIFVPLEPPRVPDLNCQREEMDVDQLARAFFVDFSVVRQVKQRDEGVFYTDGSKGLRVDSSGSIEYSAPIEEQEGEALTPGEAFRRGLEYVTVYGGWPQELDLKIAEFGKVNLEQKEFYRLELVAHHGEIPLNQDLLTLELIYDEQGLASFHRHLCQVEAAGEKEEVIDIKKALKEMVEKLPDLFARESPRRIKDLYLAYNPGPEDMESSPVEPCWVVELEGGPKVYLNARTGEPDKEDVSLD